VFRDRGAAFAVVLVLIYVLLVDWVRSPRQWWMREPFDSELDGPYGLTQGASWQPFMTAQTSAPRALWAMWLSVSGTSTGRFWVGLNAAVTV
jgi:hypothetical protein